MTNKYEKAFDDDHCSRWEGIPQAALTYDNRLHIEVLVRAMAVGPWNIRVRWDKVKWTYGLGTSFVLTGPSLASFDGDQLTRLVVTAHDLGVRVQISPCSPTAVRISMWTRGVREGPMGQRHPTMEDAIQYIRTGKAKKVGLFAKIMGRK